MLALLFAQLLGSCDFIRLTLPRQGDRMAFLRVFEGGGGVCELLLEIGASRALAMDQRVEVFLALGRR